MRFTYCTKLYNLRTSNSCRKLTKTSLGFETYWESSRTRYLPLARPALKSGLAQCTCSNIWSLHHHSERSGNMQHRRLGELLAIRGLDIMECTSVEANRNSYCESLRKSCFSTRQRNDQVFKFCLHFMYAAYYLTIAF